MTLTAVTEFAHPESTRIAVIPYDQIRFYWTATSAYDVDNPLTGFIPIQPDDWFTKYSDVTHATGYGWFIFRNSVTGLPTGPSNAIPYANFARATVKSIIDGCYSLISNNERKLISFEDALEWLNEVHDDIKAELLTVESGFDASDGSDSISVVSGTAEYALNSSFGEMIGVFMNGSGSDLGTFMTPVDIKDIDSNNLLYGSYGTRWYLRGGYIGFTPVPTTSFPVRYRFSKNATDLVSYSDVIYLPKKTFSSIKDGWLARANEKLRHFDIAKYYNEEYAKKIGKLKVQSVNLDNSQDSWGIVDSANV